MKMAFEPGFYLKNEFKRTQLEVKVRSVASNGKSPIWARRSFLDRIGRLPEPPPKTSQYFARILRIDHPPYRVLVEGARIPVSTRL